MPWQGRKSGFSAGLQTLSGALVSITFRTLAIEYRSNIVISEGWLKDRLKETGNSCIQLRRLDGNSTTEQKKKVMADFRTGWGLNMNILKKVNLLQLPDMCRCSFAIWRRIEQQQKKKYISISHPYCHWQMQNYCWWEIRKLKMRNPSEIYASSKSCDLKEDRKGVLAARQVSEQKWNCASGFVRCGGIQ